MSISPPPQPTTTTGIASTTTSPTPSSASSPDMLSLEAISRALSASDYSTATRLIDAFRDVLPKDVWSALMSFVRFEEARKRGDTPSSTRAAECLALIRWKADGFSPLVAAIPQAELLRYGEACLQLRASLSTNTNTSTTTVSGSDGTPCAAPTTTEAYDAIEFTSPLLQHVGFSLNKMRRMAYYLCIVQRAIDGTEGTWICVVASLHAFMAETRAYLTHRATCENKDYDIGPDPTIVSLYNMLLAVPLLDPFVVLATHLAVQLWANAQFVFSRVFAVTGAHYSENRLGIAPGPLSQERASPRTSITTRASRQKVPATSGDASAPHSSRAAATKVVGGWFSGAAKDTKGRGRSPSLGSTKSVATSSAGSATSGGGNAPPAPWWQRTLFRAGPRQNNKTNNRSSSPSAGPNSAQRGRSTSRGPTRTASSPTRVPTASADAAAPRGSVAILDMPSSSSPKSRHTPPEQDLIAALPPASGDGPSADAVLSPHPHHPHLIAESSSLDGQPLIPQSVFCYNGRSESTVRITDALSTLRCPIRPIRNPMDNIVSVLQDADPSGTLEATFYLLRELFTDEARSTAVGIAAPPLGGSDGAPATGNMKNWAITSVVPEYAGAAIPPTLLAILVAQACIARTHKETTKGRCDFDSERVYAVVPARKVAANRSTYLCVTLVAHESSHNVALTKGVSIVRALAEFDEMWCSS
eukprot:PhM_4_TR4130/c0_g1_i1/m.69863